MTTLELNRRARGLSQQALADDLLYLPVGYLATGIGTAISARRPSKAAKNAGRVFRGIPGESADGG